MTPSRPALVLVGHGSPRHPDAGAPLLALAETLRHSGRCGEVAARFLRQEPRLAPADPLLTPTSWVVPVLIGGGGLAEAVSPLAGPARVTPPVGLHPGFTALVAALATAAAATAGLHPAAATLLLIAHGARRPGAGTPAETLARRLAATTPFAQVTALFLEQEPRAAAWREHRGGRPVIAVPLLLSTGGHARHDLPALFAGGDARLTPPPTDPAALAAIVLDLIQ